MAEVRWRAECGHRDLHVLIKSDSVGNPNDEENSFSYLAGSSPSRAGTRAAGARVAAADGRGAEVRGRPVLAEAAAEPLGARQRDRRGCRLDATTSSSCIGNDTMNEAEIGAGRTRRPASAARRAPPVLEFDPAGQPRGVVGRAGRRRTSGPVEPRHRDRQQGQRLDRRERRQRLAHPQVHARRQVPHADRHAAPCRQSVSRHTAGNSDSMEHFGRVAKVSLDNAPTKRTSPTATATSASP